LLIETLIFEQCGIIREGNNLIPVIYS